MNPKVKNLLKEAHSDIWLKPHLAGLFYASTFRFILMRQAIPLLLASFIDSVTAGTAESSWKRILILLAVVHVASYMGGMLYRRTKDNILTHTSHIRYSRYIDQILHFPYDLIINKSRGDLLSKIRAKGDYTTDFLNMTHDIIKILLNIVISFFVIYPRSKIFGIAYILLWLPSAYTLYAVANRRVQINKSANEAWDTYVGKISDSVGNAETIIQFGKQRDEGKKLFNEGAILWSKYVERWKAGRSQINVVAGVDTLFNVLLILFGFWSIVNGSITIGTFILIQSYLGFALSDVSSISDIVRNFVENSTRAITLDEIAEEYPALLEPTRPIKPNQSDASISFNNVTFAYSDSTDATLHKFNLTIPAGQKIGVVGRSGSGKTTLTKLLLRLYQVHDGEVTICGCNIDDMGSSITRSLISYVPQEANLFHRTLRENIMFVKPNASNKEIVSAVKQSYSDVFVASLPKKLDSTVGDKGMKLSGGQRQRIAIARAILKDAPILLFDEATSALDSESEVYVQKALTAIMKNKTAIIIAHRLSTLKHMDRIVVMDNGEIVEDGTHVELLANKGLYSTLWKHQSGGFIED